MTGFSVAAFVAAKPVFPSVLCRSSIATTSASLAVRALPWRQPGTGVSKVALGVTKAGVANYAAAASGFFTSIRIPAALIAGSSLAALFTLVNESKDDEAGNRSVIESFFLLVYHTLALVSLLLSLNVIFTSTATANDILLGARDPMATSAFALLQREYPYEFLSTRWSFYTALFAFLGCITSRALLEFGLLKKKRIRSAMLVILPVSSLAFHLLFIVNSRAPSLPRMTLDLFHMYLIRCLTGKKTVCKLASVGSFVGAIFSGIQVFRLERLRLFSRARPEHSDEADLTYDEGGKSDDESEIEVDDIYASLDGIKSLETSTALEANTTTDSPE